MKELVENIINKKYDSANELFESYIADITAIKLHEAKKMVSARMSAEGMDSTLASLARQRKLRMGVLEEDDLEEMDLSREKPDYASIEDRRKGQIVQNAGKSSLPGTQNTNDEGKGDLKISIVKKTMKESDDLGPVEAKKRASKYRRKSDGKEISAVEHPGKEWELVKEETLDEQRFKIVKARVRGGKVQRRKRISNVEGFKMQGGTLKRMSPAERRRRKLGQKRGKLKRRSKMRMAMMKRKRSLRKRSSIGL